MKIERIVPPPLRHGHYREPMLSIVKDSRKAYFSVRAVEDLSLKMNKYIEIAKDESGCFYIRPVKTHNTYTMKLREWKTSTKKGTLIYTLPFMGVSLLMNLPYSKTHVFKLEVSKDGFYKLIPRKKD